MNAIMMKMSCNKALCSYVLCFEFLDYCCGFIVVHFWASTFEWGVFNIFMYS